MFTRTLLAFAFPALVLGCPADTEDTPTPAQDVPAIDTLAPDVAEPQDTPPSDGTPAPEDALPPEDVAEPLPSGTQNPPAVPGNGWAKAVVASDITAAIDSDGNSLINVAADPDLLLGPPDESVSGITAIGLVGAWVVVDMGEGTEAHDKEGPDIVVMEYGAAAGGFPEPYRVAVSESPDGPFTEIGDGADVRGFDLAEAGLASARYVRVESLATLEEITGGLGSPLYPGPEIDAIGAIYPGGAEPGDTTTLLVVSDPKTQDLNQDGFWEPGEALTISITLTNQSDDDFSWYPGVVLASDVDGIQIQPPLFWFYAIFGNDSLEATFTATPKATVPSGTAVTFSTVPAVLNCQDNGVPCPTNEPTTFKATVMSAPKVQACCSVDGQCQELTQQACLATATYHSWQAEFTCNDIDCPNEVQGACCLGNGECEISTVDACVGGNHLGKDTTCDGCPAN